MANRIMTNRITTLVTGLHCLSLAGAIALHGGSPARADTGPMPTDAVTRIAEADGIRAEYRAEPGDICVESPRLTIVRDGVAAFEDSVTSALGICQQADRFEINDLDQDGEPEVLIDFFSGGAHCCWFSQVYRYDADREQYTMQEQYWGNGGSAALSDLDDDGRPEFSSRDDRFAYQFASYAESAYPPQIWRYEGGEFVDVTRQYPQQVYDLAYGLWQRYEQTRAQGGETRSVLAAYLATKHLLGQAEDGWQRVQAAYRGRDRPQFFSNLSTFLQQTNYTAASAARSSAGEPGSPRLPQSDSASPRLNQPLEEAAILLQQQGSLESGDNILPTDGSLYDEHEFTAEAGDVVLIRLESEAFDPYLFLVGPQGELIAQNDDASDSDLSAALVLTLPQSGAYRAIANSYDSTGRGAYQLTVRRRQVGPASEDDNQSSDGLIQPDR